MAYSSVYACMHSQLISSYMIRIWYFQRLSFVLFVFLLCRNLGVEEKHHKKGSFFLVFEGSGQFLRFDQLSRKTLVVYNRKFHAKKKQFRGPGKKSLVQPKQCWIIMSIDTRECNHSGDNTRRHRGTTKIYVH